MSGTRRRLALSAVGLLTLGVTACAAPPPAPTVSPTATESPVPVAWAECDEIARLIDEAGLLPSPVEGVFSAALPDPGSLDVVYPLASVVSEAGGLACEGRQDGVHASVLALQDAGDDFAEARAAIDAVPPVNEGASRVYAESPVAGGGVVTCRDAGPGGLCTWSLASADAWVVVELFPLPLASLTFPPDLPSGWAQPPYPTPGGNVDSLVADIVATVAASMPVRAVTPPSTACKPLVTPERVVAAVGRDLGAAEVAPEAPVEVAVRQMSTAGSALPSYAARDAGWSRCVLGGIEGELIVVTRPAGLVDSASVANPCFPGEDFEEICRVVVTVGSETRVAQFAGDAGATSAERLEALLR